MVELFPKPETRVTEALRLEDRRFDFGPGGISVFTIGRGKGVVHERVEVLVSHADEETGADVSFYARPYVPSDPAPTTPEMTTAD